MNLDTWGKFCVMKSVFLRKFVDLILVIVIIIVIIIILVVGSRFWVTVSL